MLRVVRLCGGGVREAGAGLSGGRMRAGAGRGGKATRLRAETHRPCAAPRAARPP